MLAGPTATSAWAPDSPGAAPPHEPVPERGIASAPETAAADAPAVRGSARLMSRKRDDEAFGDIVAAEHDRAMRLAYLLAGDREAAEDALAEAFARTYEKWRAGKVDDVGPYLRRAVHNQVKNQRRAMARLRRHEQRRRGDDRGQGTPAGHVAARGAMVDLLDQLPYRQRAAIVLRYYEDCSEAEIAEALGVRPGTVKSLISRGLSALRGRAEAAGIDLVDAGDAA